jgi:hypothetical protein
MGLHVRHIKQFPQLFLIDVPDGVSCSHVGNELCGKRGVIIIFSPCCFLRVDTLSVSVSARLSRTALCLHVSNVFRLSTKEKMMRIAASRIIASVANAQRLGIGVIVNNQTTL